MPGPASVPDAPMNPPPVFAKSKKCFPSNIICAAQSDFGPGKKVCFIKRADIAAKARGQSVAGQPGRFNLFPYNFSDRLSFRHSLRSVTVCQEVAAVILAHLGAVLLATVPILSVS